MAIILVSLCLIWVFCPCNAYVQELTVYENPVAPSETGARIILRSKESALMSATTGFSRFLAIHKSYCYTGFWRYYSESNYQGISLMHATLPGLCYSNKTLPFTGSLRHLGPQDLSVETISFYSESNAQGEELVISARAYGHVQFQPLSVFSTGWSNWTLYSGNNFNGDVFCYQSTDEFHLLLQLNESFPTVGSVIKGCLSNSASYFRPSSLN